MRYLIASIDARSLTRRRAKPKPPEPPKTPEQLAKEAVDEEARKWWAWACSEDPRIWRAV